MRTATVNGTCLRYEERGSGPPILYVHGSGDWSIFFSRTIDEVGPGYRSIVYDRRGFAGSAGSLASRLVDHVEDAAALLYHCHATPATVVGSSAGGVVALGLATRHPETVDALVLAEPTYQPALVPSPSATTALTRIFARRWLLRDDEGAAVGLYRWVTRYRTGGNQYDSLPEGWRRTGSAHAHAALRELGQLMRPWPSGKALRSISCPVTLMIGDLGEPLFHRTSERARRFLPDPRIVPVTGTAHVIAIDRPDALAESVVDGARTG